MTGAEQDGPPGLQPERTHLSWNRAALSFAGNGALLVKVGWTAGGLASAIPGLVVLASAAVVYVLGGYRFRAEPAALAPARRRAHLRVVALLALLSGVLAVVTPGVVG